ncbi:hypothetical protein GCM10010145_04990 [Streptomyces ruber]|uniref:Uncharacterized protein n=2 Tax=Streptomyces TaxID=1883 RepID=A0A918ENE0_9ACTN|nr:hypothetical protein GCM10010145_04990 [Streptomyces ruber]
MRGSSDSGYDRDGDGETDGAALLGAAGREGPAPFVVPAPPPGHTVTATATAPPATTTPAPRSNPLGAPDVFLRGARRLPGLMTLPHSIYDA